MTAQQLVADLNDLEVVLRVDGNRLKFTPRSVVTPELVERLKAHKAELLEMLAEHHDIDGHDAGDIDPHGIEPCPNCNRLEQWQSLAGVWYCLHCEPMNATYRLLAHGRRIRGE